MNTRDYQSIVDFIKLGRSGIERKIANNTTAVLGPDGTVFIRFHTTYIVELTCEGSVLITSGGWKTYTTKERINDFLPVPFVIYQNRGEWYIRNYRTNEEYIYQDGIKFEPSGSGSYDVIGASSVELERQNKKRRAAISKYADKFTAALLLGKIPKPSAADCFYCVMRDVQHNIPLSEIAGDVSHLESHIQENYFVPSLLVRAVEVYPISIYARGVIGSIWADGAKYQYDVDGIAERKISSSIKRYLLRQFSLG
jgi:hypothetical protein